MAIKQIVPIQITLQGDGSSTAFVYALGNLYQAGVGGSIPFGTAGVVPSSVTVNNPALAITSSTVDSYGNITITFTTAPGNGVQVTLEVDLTYNSGAASSSSATQSMNVNVTGGTITATDPFAGNTGSAVPTQAAYIGAKNGSNLIGLAADASGNLNIGGSAASGASNAGNPVKIGGPFNTTQPTVTNAQVVDAQFTARGAQIVATGVDTFTSTVVQPTAASLNATVVGTGTFSVQASTANISSWGGTALGAAANFGTTPGAVVAASVNASLFSGTTALGTPNTFGTTAPTGNALGVNSSLFVGTTLATAATFGTTASGTGVLANASMFAGTTAVTAATFGTTASGTGLLTNSSLFVGTTAATAATFGTTASGTGVLANASLFIGTTIAASAASGVLKVGITGSSAVALDVAAAGAASATNAIQIAGVYNTTLPTLSNTYGGAIQLDAKGQQLIDLNYVAGSAIATAATGIIKVGLTDGSGTALPSGTFGTSPGAIAALAVNSSLYVGTTAVTAATFGTTAAGTGILANASLFSGTTAVTNTAGALNVNLSSSSATSVTVAQGTAAALTAGWPMVSGQTSETTAAWTNATTVNTTAALTVTGYGTVIVALNQGTTITQGVVTFEVSDTVAGTNWYSITGTQVAGYGTNATYTLTASTNQAFEFAVSGWIQFRVRLSTVILGTGTVNVGIAAQAECGVFSTSVGQLSAANLNATVVGTGTFAVQAAQSGNWTARVVGNAGGLVDAVQNATAPANALAVGAVYNSGGVTISSGSLTALQADASGFLKVNVAAGSSGNAAASATGSAVPANADYAGVNVGGTLRGWTAVNPSGSVYAGQIDLTSIAGSTTSTAATGVLKVGIVGNAGAAFDQVVGSAAPANALQMGGTDGTNVRVVNLNAKGTQGTYAVAVQELKDSGRTYIIWTIDAATLVTSEALISTQVNKGGTLQGAATTYTVTTGKTLRIQSISASVQGTNSAVQYAKVRFRSASSVTSSSPIVANLFVSNSGGSNTIGYAEQDFPDGIEIAAGQQVGVSQIGGTINGTITITVIAYEY